MPSRPFFDRCHTRLWEAGSLLGQSPLFRRLFTLFLPFLLLQGVLSSAGHADWPSIFSERYRVTEERLRDVRNERFLMGQPSIGQTVNEVGILHEKLAEAPPELPWVQVDLGAVHPIEQIALIPTVLGFEQLERAAYAFPKRFRIDISNDRLFRTFRRIFEQTNEDFEEVGVMPAVFPCERTNARYIRLTVTKMAGVEGMLTYSLSEMMVIDGNSNVALGCEVTSSNMLYLPPRWYPANLTDGRTPMGPPIRRSPPAFDGLFCTPAIEDGKRWMCIDLESEYPIDEVRIHPVHARQGSDFPGFAFPSHFHLELANDPSFADGRTIFDTGPTGMSNPGNNPVILRMIRRSGRYLKFVCDRVPEGSDESFGLSEIQVYSNDSNVAFSKPVSIARNAVDRPTQILTDGYTSYGVLLEWSEWLLDWHKRKELSIEINRLEIELAMQTADWERSMMTGIVIGVTSLLMMLIGLFYWSHQSRKKEQLAFQTRLAQDFHDEIGSNLAGIARLSEVAAADSPPDYRGDWMEIKRIASDTSDALRLTLWLAGARQEAGVELIQNLKKLALRLMPGMEIEFLVWDETLPQSFQTESRRHVLLFFKEAVANIVRHSRATKVQLSCMIEPRQFTLMIKDNGLGFDFARASGGTGLSSMRRRAIDLKGILKLESAVGQGTSLSLQVPL